MRALWRLLLIPCLGFAAQRAIEFRDIVEMREPTSPRISPDGRFVVYTLRESSLEKDMSRSSLWVVSPGAQPRRLLEESPIGPPVWLPGSDALIARLPRPGSVAFWRIPIQGGTPRPLFEHSEPVLAAWWSTDASRVLFTSAEAETDQARRQREREGIVYDETRHGIRNFTRNTWTTSRPPSLWLWRTGDARPERLAVNLTELGTVRSARWAPDGERAVIEYTPPKPDSVNTTHLSVLEGLGPGASPTVRHLLTGAAAARGACWQPDGRRIFFAETGTADRYFSGESRLRSADLQTGTIATLPGSRTWYFLGNVECGSDSLFIEYDNQSRSTVYRVDTSTGATVDATPVAQHLSGFHFTPDHSWAACVRQSITEPPEIARVQPGTGRVEVLTHLNPEFDNVVLASATQRRWRNRFGHESNGFLFLPLADSTRVRKPPLLLIQYHFSNKFSAQAQWMTSYPVQHLVAAGFAVLLHNYPRELGWKPGDFEGAARSQAENPLASMEAAVASLVTEGLVDPARKGIAGWSFGSWLAELAITQTDLFQAASAGEGGLNNAGQYWVTGSRAMQDYLDAFFGGPPFGAALENYKKLSPALNADKVRAPLLREYGTDVGVQSLEFYMALRRLGKPVEQIIYPGAPHIFDRPSHRHASLERNLDWFRFWLQDFEDPDPKKRDQYERWRALRDSIGNRR